MRVLVARVTPWLVVTSLIVGCASMSPAGGNPTLAGTAWVLSSLPGVSLVADALPTARFEVDNVHGSDGCNRYRFAYTVTGSTLQVKGPGMSTQMACPPAVSAQAEAFRAALTRASGYRVVDGRLELLGAGDVMLARFDAQSQSLAGTWQVTGYNNGREAVVSLLVGTAITLSFGDDGRVSGSAGCNNFTAPYRRDGAKLSIGPAAATRRMCASPAGIMEQEQQFLKALETVATAGLEGDRLEFRTAAGALAATLKE